MVFTHHILKGSKMEFTHHILEDSKLNLLTIYWRVLNGIDSPFRICTNSR